jgi:hypothetical protein
LAALKPDLYRLIARVTQGKGLCPIFLSSLLSKD